MLAADSAAQARAEAELALAQWRLDRTRIFAPADGTMSLPLRIGDMARESESLIGIVDAHAWRIIGNDRQYFIPGFVVGGTPWVWLDARLWQFTAVASPVLAEASAAHPSRRHCCPA